MAQAFCGLKINFHRGWEETEDSSNPHCVVILLIRLLIN